MNSVIFLGTPQFGATVLEGLIKAGYHILAVVTQPDKKVGRKQKVVYSPVKEVALANDLPLYQPVRLSKSAELDELLQLDADFIITAAFGQFLPTKFLKSAKIAAVNVRIPFAEMPGRGTDQYAVRNGDAETGVIMEMVKKWTPATCMPRPACRSDQMRPAGSLRKIGSAYRDLLLETLPKIASGEIVKNLGSKPGSLFPNHQQG